MRQLLLCDGINNNLTGREADTHVTRPAEVLPASQSVHLKGQGGHGNYQPSSD